MWSGHLLEFFEGMRLNIWLELSIPKISIYDSISLTRMLDNNQLALFFIVILFNIHNSFSNLIIYFLLRVFFLLTIVFLNFQPKYPSHDNGSLPVIQPIYSQRKPYSLLDKISLIRSLTQMIRLDIIKN